jgi:hypothetical protein
MALAIQCWLLKQLNADNGLDAVKVTIKFAVRQFGTKKVAKELRTLADYLEKSGTVSGWIFPQQQGGVKNASKDIEQRLIISSKNSHSAA